MTLHDKETIILNNSDVCVIIIKKIDNASDFEAMCDALDIINDDI